MGFDILTQGAFATLNVSLKQGESIKAESGAMITMSISSGICRYGPAQAMASGTVNWKRCKIPQLRRNR